MTERWPLVPLGEILTQDRNYIDRPEPRLYPKLSVKLYGKGVVLDALTDGATLRMQRHQLAKTGQVILSEIWGKKGAVGLVPPEGDGALCTSHFFLFDIRKDRVEPGYLRALFSSNHLEEQLGSEARGTTGYAAVRPQHLLAAKIPLPPPSEQRRIVARLERVSSTLEKARTLRKLAESQTHALMDSARSRFLGELGPDWIPLRTYVKDIENGWSPLAESRPVEDEEWGVLKVGAVSFGVFDWRENKALPADLSPIPEYEVKAGDFLMSRANTLELVGACAIVSDTRPRLMLSDKLFRFHFRGDRRVDQRFLDEVLKSPALRRQIEAASGGTSPTMKNISKESVLGLLVPPFDLEAQRRIAANLSAVAAAQARLRGLQEAARSELEALLNAFVAQEIGDIDVKVH